MKNRVLLTDEKIARTCERKGNCTSISYKNSPFEQFRWVLISNFFYNCVAQLFDRSSISNFCNLIPSSSTLRIYNALLLLPSFLKLLKNANRNTRNTPNDARSIRKIKKKTIYQMLNQRVAR